MSWGVGRVDKVPAHARSENVGSPTRISRTEVEEGKEKQTRFVGRWVEIQVALTRTSLSQVEDGATQISLNREEQVRLSQRRERNKRERENPPLSMISVSWMNLVIQS